MLSQNQFIAMAMIYKTKVLDTTDLPLLIKTRCKKLRIYEWNEYR